MFGSDLRPRDRPELLGTSPRRFPPEERTRELLRVISVGLRVGDLAGKLGGGTDRRQDPGRGRVLEGRKLEAHAEGFVDRGEGGVEACLLLACVARAAGDPGGAVSIFREALVLNPQCLEGEGV